MSAAAIVQDAAREEAELRAYLGDAYDHLSLQQSDARLLEEFAAAPDEGSFYRSSSSYLYNLTAFAMSQTKEPYLRLLADCVPAGARLLDYGCGIGSDGLALIEAGFQVEFADFDNPSTEYLRWRLDHRGIEAPVHDLDQGVPGGFDAVYSFDVIEHVGDSHAFLDELEARAELVAVNLLEPVDDDLGLHHELPVAELLDRAVSRDLVSHRLFYDRSHLVIYRPARGGALTRLRGAARVRSELLRRRGVRAAVRA